MKIEFVWPPDIVAQLRDIKETIMATQAENQARIDALAAGIRKVAAEIRHLKTAYEQGQELDFGAAEAALTDADALNDDLVDEAEGEAPAATE